MEQIDAEELIELIRIDWSVFKWKSEWMHAIEDKPTQWQW